MSYNKAKLISFLEAERWMLGHYIYRYESFYELGFTAEDLVVLPEVHRDLTDLNDAPVASIVGIHGLDFVQWLAKQVGVDCRNNKCLGRGSSARWYVDAILLRLLPSN